MAGEIVNALADFGSSLTTVGSTAVNIGSAALLLWIGWRLACKIPNRGVGK